MSSGRGAKRGPAGLSALWDPGLPAVCGADQRLDGRKRRGIQAWQSAGEPHRVEAGQIRVACGRSAPPLGEHSRTSKGALSRKALNEPFLSSWELDLALRFRLRSCVGRLPHPKQSNRRYTSNNVPVVESRSTPAVKSCI